jgi:hypothetical protein
MALQKTVNVKNNFGLETTLTDCYIKITRIVGDKESVSITVSYYSDVNQTTEYFNKVYGFAADVSEGSENFIKQGYHYLKSLTEFHDAVDV